MKMRVALSCVVVLSSVGCAKSDPKASANAQAAPPTAAPAAPRELAPTDTPTPSADTKTGIAECDALLAKMQACIESNKVSEAMRASYRRTFAPARDGYRKAAAGTAADKAHGAEACQVGLEAGKGFFDTCT
jgi:hypothetical protein